MSSAEDVWAWLQECEVCGKRHEYRLVESCSGPPDHRLGEPRQRTWADPIDGHAYRKRLRQDTWNNLERLRAAFEQGRGSAS